MGNTAVRRQLLLEYLLDCQHTTAGELNCAFQMCSRTIQRAVGREFDRRGQHPTVAMTGGRNDDTDSRVSGRERGGEIPMRLKLTAAGWIPDRGERGRLSYCLRGTGTISQKCKRFLYEQIVRSGGSVFSFPPWRSFHRISPQKWLRGCSME